MLLKNCRRWCARGALTPGWPKESHTTSNSAEKLDPMARWVSQCSTFIGRPRSRNCVAGSVIFGLWTMSRFGVVVTQKLAARAVPVIGALGGAAVNYAFLDHFPAVPRGPISPQSACRLERRYSKDVVRMACEKPSNPPHQQRLEVGLQKKKKKEASQRVLACLSHARGLAATLS